MYVMFLPPSKHHSRASHLTSGDDLQRAQSDLEVGGVGLEVVESLSNVLLKLGGVLPRGAVGGDLVQGLGAHLDCFDVDDVEGIGMGVESRTLVLMRL